MTDEQKRQIGSYRTRGKSYRQIAELMNMPISTVKTFCSRNFKSKSGSLCEQCGMPVEQTPGRKHKRFCTDRCRMSWWNSHQDLVKRKANYFITCQHCGKSFISYGNKHRKYCCHECYIEERYDE